MGFLDLNFRWHHENFDLYDVELLCSIKLQQLDDDGDWVEREPFLLGIFSNTDEKLIKKNTEYENPKSITSCPFYRIDQPFLCPKVF